MKRTVLSCVLAAACVGVLAARIEVHYHRVRRIVKIQPSVAGSQLAVDLPDLQDLTGQTVAVILRLKGSSEPTDLSITLDDLPVARVTLRAHDDVRVDESVKLPARTPQHLVVRSSQAGWQLTYAEVANAFGFSRGTVELVIVPREQLRGNAALPTWVLCVMALGLLWLRPNPDWPSNTLVRLLHRSGVALVVLFFAVVILASWFTRYKILISLGTFVVCSAIVYAEPFARFVLVARRWLELHPGTPRVLLRSVRGPFATDDEQLFGADGSQTGPRRAARLALLVCGFSVLVGAMTWPQVRHFDWVPDLGDPLFSIWRISWINHQMWREPLRLFDGNIFHPEHLTLTYSDSIFLPALMAAPFFWFGVHRVVVYNGLLLSGFVLSGVTMFMLVRALTGRRDAALVAGTIFALYPYRFEHYSHLELQMTMWMPLALYGMHRTIEKGRLRDGLMSGLAFALQTLSSLYYGVFLSTYIAVVGGALWLARGRPRYPLRALGAGALLASVLIAPVASQYIANKPMMGDRDRSTIQFYSAEGPDYLKAHFRSWTYSSLSHHGHPERQLFPRITPLVLAAAALWPPLSAARIAYSLGLVLAVDGSLGLNGKVYGWLSVLFPPFRGLRVPARFSLLVGMTLAILSGYGAARINRRWPRRSTLFSVAMMALVIVEAIPNMPLEPVARYPPGIYAALDGDPDAVIAEFPMPVNGFDRTTETHYLYFSTFDWYQLVNGDSGFFPPSYYELLEREEDFPSDASIGYLKSRGVRYLTVHGAFYKGRQERLFNTLAALDSRPDLELVSAARWEGAESRLYRFR